MIAVFAPAKINLTLQVGRPRADGLHPLQSVVAFASVGDWVRAAPAETLSLGLEGPFAHELEGDADNLVLRAARALAKAAGVDAGAALTLDKHLPVASGIGGGSSDAAAALKACNELWKLNWGEPDLVAVAQDLGADVPVCVPARAAYMTGAGEHFSPLALPALDAVLLNPLTPLATAAVYREFDRLKLGGNFAAASPPLWPDRDAALAAIRALGNDLMTPARALAPVIAEAAGQLAADGRVLAASLSGSGATLFALVENAAASAALADDLHRRRPDWWVRAARLA